MDNLSINVDYFICASATPFNSSNINFEDIYEDNIDLTKRIISKNAFEARKFIYISSVNAAELDSINKKSIKYFYAKKKKKKKKN